MSEQTKTVTVFFLALFLIIIVGAWDDYKAQAQREVLGEKAMNSAATLFLNRLHLPHKGK